MKVTATVTVNAPIDTVFDVFIDINQAQERIDAIKKIEFLSKNKSGKGTKWRETRVMLGKEATEEMWLSHIDSPRAYSVEAESHGTKYYSTYTFTTIEDGTEVVMEFTGTPVTLSGRVMGVMNFMFAGTTRKMLEKDMQDLKTYIEAR